MKERIMTNIDVTYNGTVIGCTHDEGKTIEFSNTKIAQTIKDEIFNSNIIGISSRKSVIINDDCQIEEGKTQELIFIKNKL